MDVLCKRFPLVTMMILKKLDDKSLVRFKEACRESAKQLVDERFYWIRIMKKYMGKFEGVEGPWKEVIDKTPVDMLKQLGFAVEKFCKSCLFRQVTPLHIIAYKGNFDLFQFAISRSKDKNPEGNMWFYVHKLY